MNDTSEQIKQWARDTLIVAWKILSQIQDIEYANQQCTKTWISYQKVASILTSFAKAQN